MISYLFERRCTLIQTKKSRCLSKIRLKFPFFQAMTIEHQLLSPFFFYLSSLSLLKSTISTPPPLPTDAHIEKDHRTPNKTLCRKREEAASSSSPFPHLFPSFSNPWCFNSPPSSNLQKSHLGNCFFTLFPHINHPLTELRIPSNHARRQPLGRAIGDPWRWNHRRRAKPEPWRWSPGDRPPAISRRDTAELAVGAAGRFQEEG